MKRRVVRITAVVAVGVAAAALTGMFAEHGSQQRTLAAMWQGLYDDGGGEPFRAAMVEGLPPAAERWLLHAIADGTPLARTALLRMHGSLQLKEGSDPWLMRAEQILTPHRGFIWRATVGSGLLRIRGFDRYAAGVGEMRWWMFGVVPVVREQGADVTRSAGGRLAGEATLVPSTLLPHHGVRWEHVSDDVARATFMVDGEPVSFAIDVAPSGRLQRVVIDRWNADPRNGNVGVLPFVVEFEGERVHGGYTVPAHMRAGWMQAGVVRVFFDAEITEATYR